MMLRGWNGYYNLEMDKNNNPEWHLCSHWYYGISILHTKIIKINGRWFLIRETYGDKMIHGPRSDSPLGEWGDILVTKNSSLKTWIRSNNILIIPILIVTAILYKFCTSIHIRMNVL